MNLIGKIFSAVMPLKGSKTVIGGWLVALGSLHQLFPGVDLGELMAAIIANPTKAGVVLAILGLADRAIQAQKDKYKAPKS